MAVMESAAASRAVPPAAMRASDSPCVVNGPHEGVAGRSGAFRPGVFVYAVEVCFAQRPASLCDGWLRARRSYGEEAAVKDDIGRSTAPHHAAAARYHERDGECSATVAVTAVERCGERLCRASPREEPPPFFVAERFYAYRMGCLCRKGGRQQGERDEDWKSPVHGVVGLGISTRRSCGAFARKMSCKIKQNPASAQYRGMGMLSRKRENFADVCLARGKSLSLHADSQIL